MLLLVAVGCIFGGLWSACSLGVASVAVGTLVLAGLVYARTRG